MQMSILAIHLFNDYSGSPRVLADSLEALRQRGWTVQLITSDSKGILSNLHDIPTHTFKYQFSNNKWLRLFRFMAAQCTIMYQVWTLRKSTSCIYINTLLPFGAALMGYILGKPIIYHLHETSLTPFVFKFSLQKMAQFTASHAIYVSRFLEQKEGIRHLPSSTIYNSLSTNFINTANTYLATTTKITQESFTCLMACSLKSYKGIDQYINLAKQLPHICFHLVINAGSREINTYFDNVSVPINLVVFPAQKNMHWFYQQAHIVLNLSLPDRWVETFGMTLLEAMQYGKVPIGPMVGGPVEVIQNNYSGYTISAYDTDQLRDTIQTLSIHSDLYTRIAKQSRKRASFFSSNIRREQLHNTFSQLLNPSTPSVSLDTY